MNATTRPINTPPAYHQKSAPERTVLKRRRPRPAARPFTPDDKRMMVRMVRNGYGPAQIGKVLGRTRTVIHQWLVTNVHSHGDASEKIKLHLIEIDAKFCALMEDAIRRGLERDPR